MTLPDLLLSQEPAIRLGIFAAVFAVMALWEHLSPFHADAAKAPHRWRDNLLIFVLDIGLARLAFPFAAVAMAALARQNHWGVFHQVNAPDWFSLVAGIVLLDLVIYFQHRIFHAVPLLWRAHRMHHSDTGFDVSTGLRFHPLEIGVSLLLKFGVILLLGVPPLAVLVFEVLLNAAALFNHGNVAVPEKLSRWLPWVVVTPAMHRVHHSSNPAQTNTNFGFSVPWWDWWFGTFLNPAQVPLDGVEIGLKEFRSAEDQSLAQLLAQPFLSRGLDNRPPV